MQIITPSLLVVLAVALQGRAVSVDADTFSTASLDSIVVGAGTAGTALAVRLSEVPSFRVGLIEAGNQHKDDPKLLIPHGYLAFNTWGDPEYDWSFNTTAQKNLGGRSLNMVRGKGLGGCSQINDMGYLRAGGIEYDMWGQLGNPGWSWAETLHYLKKAETNSIVSEELQKKTLATVDPRYRGSDGPIHTSFSKWYSEAVIPFYSAMQSLGLQTHQDVGDGGDADWIGNPALAINYENQTRSYAGNGYYEPNAARTNLLLLTGAQVARVLFYNTAEASGNFTATGIEYVDAKSGKKYTAQASKEVILSAGAVQSPQLLELSGIGRKDLLTGLGIKVRIDNPNVGENYQDHLHAQQIYTVPESIVTWDILSDSAVKAEQLELYNKTLTGLYTAGINAMAYISAGKFIDQSTANAWITASDDQFYATKQSAWAKLFYELGTQRLNASSTEATLEVYAAPANAFPDVFKPNTSYLQMAATPQHPLSRGFIHINSSNPLVPPVIEVNTFGLDIDRKILLEGSKFVRKIAETKEYAPIIVSNVVPPQDEPTDDEWNQYIAERTAIPFHPCCTAAMLPRDLDGVVDPKLIVYGTANLRVVDASIMPFLPATHIMATTYTIGEHAADLIKSTHGVQVADPEADPNLPQDDMETFRAQAAQILAAARNRAAAHP